MQECILIADQSIHYRTATFIPPKGFPTTQFDMVVAEDIGLHKFDILSQRGLSKIQDALALIRLNNGTKNLLTFVIYNVLKRMKKSKNYCAMERL